MTRYVPTNCIAEQTLSHAQMNPTSSIEFETHITLDLANQALQSLMAWSQARALKCVHIELARGVAPSQPMITTWGKGNFATQLAAAQNLARELENAGFPVVRVKLEVADESWNEFGNAVGRYFEHHLKLLIPPQKSLDELEKRVQKHGAHLSRNARRVRDDGQNERFITQRVFDATPETARAAFETLEAEIAELDFQNLEVEREFVVFDSNFALDAGWLNEEKLK